MVTRDYMLDQPPPPPAWRQFVNLEVVPAAINALGAVETVIEKAAVRARTRPATSLGVALGAGCGLAFLSRRWGGRP